MFAFATYCDIIGSPMVLFVRQVKPGGALGACAPLGAEKNILGRNL